MALQWSWRRTPQQKEAVRVSWSGGRKEAGNEGGGRRKGRSSWKCLSVGTAHDQEAARCWLRVKETKGEGGKLYVRKENKGEGKWKGWGREENTRGSKRVRDEMTWRKKGWWSIIVWGETKGERRNETRGERKGWRREECHYEGKKGEKGKKV